MWTQGPVGGGAKARSFEGLGTLCTKVKGDR